MSALQKYFRQFHEKIQLNDKQQNEKLREKRENLILKLREELKKQQTSKGTKIPSFSWFNQGSYAMNTGIKPQPDGDYDIDIGLMFNLKTNDYDPIEVKKWVYNALKTNPTQKVGFKGPCITVTYQKKGRDRFHVDLVVYSKGPNPGGYSYMAKGHMNSKGDNRKWEQAEPEEFIRMVKNHLKGEDRVQFCRVIRYLKRWKDEQFPSRGKAAPLGIGITVAALTYFKAMKTNQGYDDLEALIYFTNRFYHALNRTRESIKFPCKPHGDLFEGMGPNQISSFRNKLNQLKQILEQAKRQDPEKACKELRKQFGNDFPVADYK